MDNEKKKLIAETVDNLKHLDRQSLLLVKNGSEFLKIRSELDQENKSSDDKKAG